MLREGRRRGREVRVCRAGISKRDAKLATRGGRRHYRQEAKTAATARAASAASAATAAGAAITAGAASIASARLQEGGGGWC